MLTLTTPASSDRNGAGARALGVCVADVLTEVLAILRARTGVDFASYRPAMLERRVASHFAKSGAASSEDYLRQLQGEPIVSRGVPAYRVPDNLRARVCFSRHDLTSSTPPPGAQRFDIVSCRNVLIYLQPAAQAEATRRLLDATDENGVLCVGEAEWPLPPFAAKLQPLPPRTRLFRMRAMTPRFQADQELNRAGLRGIAPA